MLPDGPLRQALGRSFHPIVIWRAGASASHLFVIGQILLIPQLSAFLPLVILP